MGWDGPTRRRDGPRADGRVLAVEACMAAGCGLSPPAAGAHAVTPPAMTATTVSQTIRILLPSH